MTAWPSPPPYEWPERFTLRSLDLRKGNPPCEIFGSPPTTFVWRVSANGTCTLYLREGEDWIEAVFNHVEAK